MNCTIFLTGILQRGIKPLFATSNGLLAQRTRNTFILRRAKPLPFYPRGGRPHKFRPRNYIYELVEDTEVRKHKPIDIILTEYVSGMGSKGETLSVKPITAYNKYLLPGLAVYANPENIVRYKELMEKAKSEMPEYSSPWAPRTMKILSVWLLTVQVNQHNPWTLQKVHVRAAFRKDSIHVPDEAITMPKHEITGPDMEKENKEFYVTVTINQREQVKVRCRLHHYTNIEREKIPYLEYWKQPAEPIFPEDQSILDSLPRHPHYPPTDAESAV